jgi:hypothetical protein
MNSTPTKHPKKASQHHSSAQKAGRAADETSYEEIVTFVRSVAQQLQSLWQQKRTELVHSEFTLLPYGMAQSYGLAVPAACILFDELKKAYPHERFVLQSGVVRRAERVSIPSHIWVSWIKEGGLDGIGILDAAADHAVERVADGSLVTDSNGSVIALLHVPVAQSKASLFRARSIVYDSHREFRSVDELIAEFSKREPEVGARIARARRYYETI